MPDSTLDPARSTPPEVDKGHGTRSLGPSDTTDSGSDLLGPGLYETDADTLGLDASSSESAFAGTGAGRDVGDGNLDSDTDASGTGERASAGRDDVEPGSDIAPDRLIGPPISTFTDALDRIALELVDDDSEPDSDADER